MKEFKVGTRIEYDGRESTLIGFNDKSRNYFQIEFDDSNGQGHEGNDELYDDYENKITVGLGKNNRWNLSSTDRAIKIIEPITFSNGLYNKAIDKDSSELAKQGIARI